MSTPIAFLDPDVQEYLKKAQRSGAKKLIGLGCTRLPEIVPKKTPVECEKIYEGLNNTMIALGRDCPAGIFSGANRYSQSGMIDIVAGRMSSIIHRELNPKSFSTAAAQAFLPGGDKKEENLRTGEFDRNFFSDAARVYISQRTLRIDEYLGFSYKIGHNGNADTINLSAAVVKADCTRIVGRENVRIYAGGARADNFGSFGEPRSDNSDIVRPKIELIVGNKGEDTLEPAVLGNRLVSYLKANNKIINKQNRILQNLIQRVIDLSFAAASNPATAGAFVGMLAKHAISSVEDVNTITKKLINQVLNDANHLDDMIVKGKKSVLSEKVYLT